MPIYKLMIHVCKWMWEGNIFPIFLYVWHVLKNGRNYFPRFLIWDLTHLNVQPIEGNHVCWTWTWKKLKKFFNIIVTLHDERKDGQCLWWISPIFFMSLKLNYWFVVQFFFIFNVFHYMHCCSIKMAYSINNYIIFVGN